MKNGSLSSYFSTLRHFLGATNYTPISADQAIADGEFDLVAIGRPFIANPDYIEKVKNDIEPTPYDDSMLLSLK